MARAATCQDAKQRNDKIMSASRANIYEAKEWFKVLQTTPRSQTAVMTLGPRRATGDEPEAHEASNQVLLLIEGELAAEIEGVWSRMKAGDVVVIPPGTKHKFTNPGDVPAVTFSVYSPPEYPSDERADFSGPPTNADVLIRQLAERHGVSEGAARILSEALRAVAADWRNFLIRISAATANGCRA
jgi:mannose-6-phosphate isomerase-like protein (cupin superfamily)